MPARLDRVTLPGARDDKLFFAQVREDPLLEIEALAPGEGRTVVVVSSGGDTALSLLAAGAGRVVAVDLNRVQNHLVELKAAAIAGLDPGDVVPFLGGAPTPARARRALYRRIAGRLSRDARAWWDAHRRAVGKGVLTAGVTERFIGTIMRVVRIAIHPPERVRRLLAASTLDEQRAFYRDEWDTWRWRLLFDVLLNRTVFRKTYHPAFFEHVENPSFARHFRALAAHALTEVPVATNYFVHQMLTGSYPLGVPGGLPPYLDPAGLPVVTSALDRLTLVDGGVTDYLRTRPDGSVDGFAISNILEWFTPAQVDELFAEVVRTAAPGARFVFRNFVGWTEVPTRWQDAVVEDRALGEQMIKRDRSAVQRRIAVCRVSPEKGPVDPVARDAEPADNDALVALSLACPMEGDIGLSVDRSPDFFALNRLEGDRWRVGVVDGPDGVPVGCISVAERLVHLDGEATEAVYVSDLKVHPEHRGGGVADALTTWARDVCIAAGGEDVPAFLTILAGNKAMERRMSGPRGLPHIERLATVRAHSVPLLWRRRPPDAGVQVVRAGPGDLEEMAVLWAQVAPARQFSQVVDAPSLAAWIEAAPGLEPSSYWLARRPGGELAGFVGVWDQSSFKRLRITSYSRKLAAVRAAFNLVAPLAGATRLPGPGGALRNLNAVHVCVAPDEPLVLRALLLAAYDAARGQGYSFLSVGLDTEDPLSPALEGLLSQPTDVWFCVAFLGGRARAASRPDGRPVQHEIALV